MSSTSERFSDIFQIDPLGVADCDISTSDRRAPKWHTENVIESDFNRQVGQNLRDRRTARRQTQDQLATALHLQRTSVVNIEAGRQSMSLYTAVLAATALGCAVTDLIPASERTDFDVDVAFGDTEDASMEFLDRIRAGATGG